MPATRAAGSLQPTAFIALPNGVICSTTNAAASATSDTQISLGMPKVTPIAQPSVWERGSASIWIDL